MAVTQPARSHSHIPVAIDSDTSHVNVLIASFSRAVMALGMSYLRAPAKRIEHRRQPPVPSWYGTMALSD